MKITFMVTRDRDFDSLDVTQLSQQSDIAVKVSDSEEGFKNIIDLCTQKKPDSVVFIARDPLRLRNDRTINLTQRLVETGMNPSSFGFVNLNCVVLCTNDDEQIMERLLFTTALAHNRATHGNPMPMEEIQPVKRCLIIGEIPKSDTAIMTENGIELIESLAGSWTEEKTAPDIDDFSGLPGNYHLRLITDDTTKEDITCGAIVINVASLNLKMKKKLSKAMKIPLPDGEFRLPPDRKILTTGVWIVNEENVPTDPQWSNELSVFLNQNTVKLHLDACTVDLDKCGFCGTCVKTCMFSANSINIEAKEISFDQTRCTGCGNCVTACPVLARDLPHYSNSYMNELVENLRDFEGKDNIKILALFCENNGTKALNQIAISGKQLTCSYYFLPIKCGARVGTEIIPDSFQVGFDGVALLVCARDQCNFLVGSLDLERRFNLYRTIMKSQGQESGRMRIFSIKQKELEDVLAGMEQFAEYLQELQSDQSVFEEIK